MRRASIRSQAQPRDGLQANRTGERDAVDRRREPGAGARGGTAWSSAAVASRSDAGEALVVTGPNGAGKSTLLRIIAGLLPAASRDACALEGGRRATPAIGAACHYLGHLDALKTALTAAREPRTSGGDLLRRARGSPPRRRRCAARRPRAAGRPARRLSLGRPAPAGRAGPAAGRPAAALAARRADRRARRGSRRRRSLRADAAAPRRRAASSSRRPTRRSAGRATPRSLRARRRAGADARDRPFLARCSCATSRSPAGRRRGAGSALFFFLMVVTIVPFGVGPDLNLLARIGPAILWIAALLATLLGLDRLFQADREDGSLDLLRAAPAAARRSRCWSNALAHWLATGLPLVVAAPLLGLLLEHGAGGDGGHRR